MFPKRVDWCSVYDMRLIRFINFLAQFYRKRKWHEWFAPHWQQLKRSEEQWLPLRAHPLLTHLGTRTCWARKAAAKPSVAASLGQRLCQAHLSALTTVIRRRNGENRVSSVGHSLLRGRCRNSQRSFSRMRKWFLYNGCWRIRRTIFKPSFGADLSAPRYCSLTRLEGIIPPLPLPPHRHCSMKKAQAGQERQTPREVYDGQGRRVLM